LEPWPNQQAAPAPPASTAAAINSFHFISLSMATPNTIAQPGPASSVKIEFCDPDPLQAVWELLGEPEIEGVTE